MRGWTKDRPLRFLRWHYVREPTESRFWRFVQKTKGCWLWLGGRRTNGYGHFSYLDGNRVRGVSAHRMAWQLAFGRIPPGQQVLHRCDNRACVWTRHLFLGDQADNVADMVSKGRQRRGTQINTARLTARGVRQLRRMAHQGVSCADLGTRFGISRQQARKVAIGLSWRHVR